MLPPNAVNTGSFLLQKAPCECAERPVQVPGATGDHAVSYQLHARLHGDQGGSSDESGETRAPLTAGNSMEPLLISPNKFEEEGEKRRREDKKEEESPFWSSILPPPLMVTKRTQEYIQWMRKLKDFVQQ